MNYNKTENERLNWFIDRIGKRVFRNDVTCQCETCQNISKSGIVIEDNMHAEYLYDCEGVYSIEGAKLRYFDTKEEVLEWEASL
jgi:hypothetical protein